ncbi:gamma-glutamylcyclotransferase [Desulfoferrobacter suflitae]|uniref:gamma-glutamylcyclotransferase n=1 Tax=Desulfoferrobacter suflitae TaxID=2865782 RepID=UPI00338F263A
MAKAGTTSPCADTPLRLFVYGTLKGGCVNHAAFCRGTSSVELAQVRGRLYELPTGFPVLLVPAGDILAGPCRLVALLTLPPLNCPQPNP